MTSTWLPIGIDNAGLFRNVIGGIVSLSTAGAVTSVTGGTGITVGGTAAAPTISNSGIITVVAGTGISSTGGQNPTLANTGILAVTAGTGISSTGGQSPTLSNSGILSITAGSGVSSTGGQNPTLSVTGVVTSVTAGTNISLTGTGTAPVVNLADSVALTSIAQAIQLSNNAQIYFANTAQLKRDVVSVNATTTTVTGNGWLVLINFAGASFDTSAGNPAKVTLNNNKITAGTDAVRCSIVSLNPITTVMYTVAVGVTTVGQCELWFFEPGGGSGPNVSFGMLVEVMNG